MDHLTSNLDRVVLNAIKVMEDSKYQVYEICESARKEFDSLEQELEQVLQETVTIIDKVDQLEMSYRHARIRLTEVSRDFVRYTEADIKTAYEKATFIQTELAIFREKEQYLKARRDDLQKRARNVEQSIERAEMIASQMNVVLEYLSGDLNQVTKIVESAKTRQLLGLKIILAQEDERKRIAREIHDGPAQSLANIVLRTEIAERMLVREQFELAHHELMDLKGQVRTGLEEIRKIIFNLRPMALDDLGLVPALRKFTQDFEEKSKILTKYELAGKEIRLPSAMEAAIFRLVQEAFSNILKHASATFVVLEITFKPGLITLMIQDNGIGFSINKLDKLSASPQNSHFGIIGMRERVELVNGKLNIDSVRGEGTTITINIPTTADGGKEHERYELESR